MIEIPEEIMEKSIIHVNKDTDPELLNAIRAYNDNVGHSRTRKRQLSEIVLGYYIITLLPIALIFGLFAPANNLSIILGIIFAATYLNFAVFRRNYLFSSLAVIILLFLDWSFLAVLAGGLGLYYMHKKAKKRLENELGYPLFVSIGIRYETGGVADISEHKIQPLEEIEIKDVKVEEINPKPFVMEDVPFLELSPL
jgi:hypothetical protein